MDILKRQLKNFNLNKGASLGIDIGGTYIKFGVIKDNKIIEKNKIPTLHFTKCDDLIDYIIDEALKLVNKYGVTKVGVGVPGIIIHNKVTSVNLPFSNTPLSDIFSKKLNISVKVENDANCAAYGESRVGEGKNYNSLIMLTLGTGIGGGVIIDNKIYRGRGDAGEVGHMIIEKDGIPCGCGQRGCFEKYASASALCCMAQKAAVENSSSTLYSLYEKNNLIMDGIVVFEALAQGCPVAHKVFNEFISYLATGIISLIRIFSPDVIVLSGGITDAGDFLLKSLMDKIKSNVPVKISKLQSDAGIIGAALL